MPLPRREEHYTYADYAAWDTEERYELIDGVPYLMSPAPRTKHQRITGRLYSEFDFFLRGKTCEVFIAPFDVRLNADTYDDIVVQPDITIICDKSKIDDMGCKGVPDMVVEVLSPSSARYDKVLKFDVYLKAGVREYWIVDPDSETISVHILQDGEYAVKAYGENDTIPVRVLEGCKIETQAIFSE